MNHKLLPVLILLSSVAGARADRAPNSEPEPPASASAAAASHDFVVMPGSTNALQFRLYTNAAPDSKHLFNTFDIDGFGEALLRSPGLEGWKQAPVASPSNAPLHNILVNGEGPNLAATNSMTVIEQAAGVGWRYLALDASAAYRGRVEQYKRAILFVEPDLFVVHDHLVAKEPASVQMMLHPPAATRVDAIWRDLRLELPKAGLRIQVPGRRHELHSWKRIESAVDSILPGTVTMQLGPTATRDELDLVTVLAVYRAGGKKDYACKFLESNSAVGARIHREGLPTLVAFKISPDAGAASLTGFMFSGPVGVDVFKPKPRTP